MSSSTEKPHTMQPCSPSPSWLRCVALFAMAITGALVGLWHSHLPEVASVSAWLLFLLIILLTVGLGALAVSVLQHLSDSPAKSKTEPSGLSLRPFGSVRVSKSRTRKAAAKVAAIAIMVGLGLLAILPIVAIIKVTAVESKMRLKNETAIVLDIGKPFSKSISNHYHRMQNEYRSRSNTD